MPNQIGTRPDGAETKHSTDAAGHHRTKPNTDEAERRGKTRWGTQTRWDSAESKQNTGAAARHGKTNGTEHSDRNGTERNGGAIADTDNSGYYPRTGMDEGAIQAPAWTKVLSTQRHGRGYYPCTSMDEGTIQAPARAREGTIQAPA